MNLNEIFEYKEGNLYWKQSFNNAIKIGDKAGVNGKRHARVNLFGKRYMVHHIVWEMIKGKKPTQIDHINGNGLDNRIENLREASQSQNMFNRRISSNNTSGIKGVTWNKAQNKWRVGFQVQGQKKSFGSYFDKEVARFVAETMRHKYHKEFANHG